VAGGGGTVNLCTPHRTGVSPGCPPFFQPGCPMCEAKLRAGLVTGDEGLPDRDWRRRQFPFVDHERRRRQKAARRNLMRAVPPVARRA
jgi:hypothetical protein